MNSITVLDPLAETYVRLCFSLEAHLPGYVDAYFGPPRLKQEAEIHPLSLEEVQQSIAGILAEAEGMVEPLRPGKEKDRARSLVGHLRSMKAASHFLTGEGKPFDQESGAVYQAVCPPFPDVEVQSLLQQIDDLLPGEENLATRMETLRQCFHVPPERLPAVLDAAIGEARRRTKERIELPDGESFISELVTGQPWSGYNWFQGDARSLIQINIDLPVELEMVILLACHEGYPGHHVWNCLREQGFYRQHGWVEFSIAPLFCPDALLAEGSANFGIEVAFPDMSERIAFERKVLCPLAGLDDRGLERYHQVLAANARLGYAEVEIAREYLDGKLGKEEALHSLVETRLISAAHADQQLRFFERYRSYLINYSLGRDLVRGWVERRGGIAAAPARRWEVFRDFLSRPLLPADLAEREESPPKL
jgi:hypothetical protein